MRDVSVESKPRGFSLTRYNNLLVAVAGLVSAGLLYFGTGLHPTWWLLWAAPFRRLRLRRDFAPAALSYSAQSRGSSAK